MRSPTSRSAASASVRSNSAEPLGKRQRGPILAAVQMISPQPTKCPQLTLGVVKPLGNLQGVRPSCAGFRRRTFGVDQRRSECSIQLHFVARASRRIGPEVGERMFDSPATFVQQRQVHPQRHRDNRQGHADRCVASRRKRPVQRRANIVDPRLVSPPATQPWVASPIRLGPLEEVPVIFGVAPCRPNLNSPLSVSFLKSVGSRRLKQPIVHPSVAGLRRDERLCD